jgi:hypothetical protein
MSSEQEIWILIRTILIWIEYPFPITKAYKNQMFQSIFDKEKWMVLNVEYNDDVKLFQLFYSEVL